MQENTHGGRICPRRRLYGTLIVGIGVMLGEMPEYAEETTSAVMRDEIAALAQSQPEEDERTQRLLVKLIKKMREIDAGGDVNALDSFNQTALMYASAINHYPAVCWLVAMGAKTDLKSSKGKTALDYATHARVLALLRMVDVADANKAVVEESSHMDMGKLALRVRASRLTQLDNQPDVIIDESSPGEVRQLALALHLPLNETPPATVQTSCDVKADEALLHGILSGTDKLPDSTPDIPTLINRLHNNGWKPNAHTWQLFLSEYLASNHPPRSIDETGEKDDLLILQALARASDGKAPVDAATLLPEASPFLPAPHMARLMGQLLLLGASPNGKGDQKVDRTPLSSAVSANDETLVRALLAAGADTNAKFSPDRITALHLAQTIDIAKTLLVAGADVRTADESCHIIPFLVSHPRAGQDLAALCQFWATHGANVNSSAISSIHPDVPPDTYISLIRLFGGAAGVNVRLDGGRTPLHSVVNSPAHVQALIKAGAQVNAADGDGATPLHIVSNQESALLLTRAGANLSVPDNAGLMPLHRALEDPERVAILIRAGADVNAKDAHGRSSLELTTNINTLQLLIRAGADVNAKDSSGQTLLHRLVNSPSHVTTLLQAGAEVNAADIQGRTPLHLATNLNSIHLLAQAGASLNAPDAHGLSPLHLAADSPERVEALIQAGADVNSTDPSGRSPLHITTSARTVELLARAGADVNSVDNLGNTPLMAHAAVDNPVDVSAAEALLDAGADTTVLNHQGASALKIAHKRPDNRRLIIELFEQRNITDIMLDPQARDAQGRTSLMLLVMDSRPHIPTIQKLLTDGADVNALDHRGYSAIMHLLTTCDNPELLALLLDAGARIDLWSRDRKTPLSLAQEFHRDASAKLLTEYNISKFDYIISTVLPKVQFPESYRSFRNRSDYPLTYDTWRDPDALSASGKFLVVINLSSQRGLFIVANRPAMDFPVCTGRAPRHATPTGFFRISQKDRYHRSNLYHTSMPFFMRLTNDGVGLHVGSVLRIPNSHGCIRMQRDICSTLFKLLPLGAEVVICE